jgi:hypothetical protein
LFFATYRRTRLLLFKLAESLRIAAGYDLFKFHKLFAKPFEFMFKLDQPVANLFNSSLGFSVA